MLSQIGPFGGLMTRRIAFLLLCTLPTIASAQARGSSDDARARAALAPLSKLVGQWDGEARVSMIPGAMPQVVRQHYDVTSGPGGTTLNLKGIGRATTPAGKDSVVFQATATLFYDDALGKLRVRARVQQGDSVLAEVEQKPDTLIWGFPIQGGRVRFTIAYSNTDWHEVGHFVTANGQSIPTVDMRLKKVK
jgi:hypothetical protein